MSDIRLETPRSVRVVEVVRVEAARGKGIPGDPIRVVTQFWDFDGNLLAEHDPSREVE